MKLLIKFPTRQRPKKFLRVLHRYLNYLSDTDDYEVIISADLDDSEMNNSQMRSEIEKLKNTRIFYSDSTTKIEAVNADIQHCKDFDILLLASDDMLPKKKGYDRIIRDKMQTHFPDTDGVLFFNDGYLKRKLNTLSIMGRKYYDRFGYIYHPAYISFYCDNEFMQVADCLGKMEYFDQVIIEHNHYSYSKRKPDTLYRKNDRFLTVDKETFDKRKAENFNLEKIVV